MNERPRLQLLESIPYLLSDYRSCRRSTDDLHCCIL